MNDIDQVRRAEAAEKTVNVLKDRVRALLNGGQGVIDRQMERARLREERSRQKRELMALRTAELEKHNSRLEQVVADRTRALTNILDNVTSGFLVVGADHAVREGYTKSCHVLFGATQIAGRPFAALVTAGGKSTASLEANLSQVFEDILPEEVTLDQLPHRFVLEAGHTLEARPRVIRDVSGAVEAILMSVDDVSALEAARREAQENAAIIGILRSRMAFLDFLADAREEVRLARGAADKPEVQPIVRRLVHTLKGNAASFGMASVYQLIHQIEDEPYLGAPEISRIEVAFRDFLARHSGVLDMSWDTTGDELVLVPGRRIDVLRRCVAERDVEGAQQWVEALHDRPAGEMLGPVDRLVSGLADRLGKEVHFVVEGGAVPVDPDQLRPVFRNLGHLLRNAIDHGIEAPGERGAKPRAAELCVSIEAREDAWRIRVRDDGRGIDAERLVACAIESGRVSPEGAAALTYEDKVALVFVDGLSSAERTTEISGRGVGMSAVRHAVQQVAGVMSLESRPGEGTEVVIDVPARRRTVAERRMELAAQRVSLSA
jgi:two-component system chemotaxis sensor kinase CheA